jgi:hypothetical protein
MLITNNLLPTRLLAAAGQITNPILGNKLQEFQTTAITGGSATAFWNIFLPNLVTLGFMLCSIVAFFWLIMGALKWITAGGDKANYDAAQKHITQAIVGLAILFGLLAFMKLLETILDISLFEMDLSNLFIK